FNNSWVSGNAIAFFIKGSGVREIEVFESDPTKAAELVVTFTGTQTTTAVYELEKTSFVEVFPNPFKGSFNVNVALDSPSDITISTFDLTGKQVEEKVVKQAEGSFHYSSNTTLSPGMYLVKVKVNESEKVYKIISE
ncbi:MAG: T9SS type A sorting domain-containing protein, partial [Bacteroidia bacterium]|nr:T9SS type A sorting domain-containing protein [Bacteroidia bacterium]